MARLDPEFDRNVFINCPFDPVFAPLFEAIVFCVHALGFRARCALERLDSSQVRIQKILQLIRSVTAAPPPSPEPRREEPTGAIKIRFKTQGDKVTGTLDNAAQAGATELKDVKVTGDQVSFHVVRTLNNAETKVEWTGKLAGDELKLQRAAVAGNAATDVVAKRVK